MWKNKDIRWMLCVQITTVLVLCMFTSRFPQHGWKIILAAGSMVGGVGWIVLAERNRKIAELSGYLNQIVNGNYLMDIRDNEEGELSYLKTEIYKVTRRLAEQAELLKKDKVYLAESMADISHQLKTPLTSMMVMSDLLLQEELPFEKRKEFTERILSQLERMEWLLTSLLKISKMDAGTIQLKQEEVKAKELIKEALDPLLIPAELKEIQIEVEGEEESCYIGDFEWSKEALVNIIKNCLEHTEIGGKLQIRYRQNPLYTEITIEDTGEGIAPEDLPYIFERFYRGKNASSDSVGIGLAMAKNIMLKQRGQIEVESYLKKGSKFKLKFYNKRRSQNGKMEG